MGGKWARKGKHLLLHLACAGIVLMLAGCACLPQGWPGGAANPLAEAREHWSGGRFEEALAQADTVLQTRPDRFGDEALFLKGLLYADASNPDADLGSAIEAFQGVGRRFPESPLRKKADLWTAAVRETLEAREGAAAASERSHLLEVRLQRQKRVSRFRKNQVERLQDRVDRLQERIQDLESRMEQMKRVDMELEEQKQKTLR